MFQGAALGPPRRPDCNPYLRCSRKNKSPPESGGGCCGCVRAKTESVSDGFASDGFAIYSKSRERSTILALKRIKNVPRGDACERGHTADECY